MMNPESRIQNPGGNPSRALWRKRRNVSSGFTLIELLAAMAILVIITLIVSKIFQQANVAWGAGVRKAETTMKGRSVADYIAQDLAGAVSNGNLYQAFAGDGSAPEFWSLGEATGANRAVRYVKYASSGGITRQEDSGTSAQLVGSGATLTIQCIGGTATTLPLYAIVKVVVVNGTQSAQYQSTAYFSQSKRNNF